MAKQEGSDKSRTECGVDKRVVEWRVVVLPGRCVVFECDEQGFVVGDEET